MLDDKQKATLVKFVNAAIDLPLVGEESEAKIFAHIVNMVDDALDEVLPPIFADMMNRVDEGLDRDQLSVFATRLAEAISVQVMIPYLTEDQELRLIQFLVNPIVKAMSQGRNFDSVLAV